MNEDFYDVTAEQHGWTLTPGLDITGIACSVWQRGDEVIVYLPAPAGSPRERGSATYDGRLIALEQLGTYLSRDPRPAGTLVQHIEADKAGMIAMLAAQRAERIFHAGTTDLKREQHRLRSEADGLTLAIHFLQSWEKVL